AAIYLRNLGFRVRSGGSRIDGEPRQASEAIEHSQLARCGRRVLAALGVAGQVVKQPSHTGSTDVTLLLGKDAAANPALAAADEPDSVASSERGGRGAARATD